MYKFFNALLRKFISIHELRPASLLGMVLASLTNSVMCNIAAVIFIALVHLPLLVLQDKSRVATFGSATLVTGGIAKIGIFTLPAAKISFFTFTLFFVVSSLAPTVGNFLFSLLKIRDIILNKKNPPLLARDIALAVGLILATILLSIPLWGVETPLIHAIAMACKLLIILSVITAIALMVNLRYLKQRQAYRKMTVTL